MPGNTKYIFSINTGRSGSHYLCRIFNHVSGCKAFHEPKPIGNGQEMRKYLAGKPTEMRELTEKKVKKILNVQKECDTYVETNHCFIKGFGWFIPEYLDERDIGVIILSRPKKEVVDSLGRIGVSQLLPNGRKWLMLPAMRNPLVPPPSRLVSAALTYRFFRILKTPIRRKGAFLTWGESIPPLRAWISQYETECLNWYVDELTAQTDRYEQVFKKIRFYKTDIYALNTVTGVQQMLEHFGFEIDSALVDIIGEPTNLKSTAFESADHN